MTELEACAQMDEAGMAATDPTEETDAASANAAKTASASSAGRLP